MTAARDMYSRAGWTVAFALVIYYINHREYPGPALTLTLVLVLIGLAFAGAGYGMAWLAGPGRERVLNQVLDSVKLSGSERILDAGSNGGQLGLAAARRVTSGKVIALGESSENESPREKAKNEGLADRIRFESTDWTKLGYPDANFDCIVGSQVLGRLETDAQCQQAARELRRVLKPGGRVVLHELGNPDSTLQTLTRCGFVSVDVAPSPLPLGLGGRIFLTTNPS